MHKLYVQVLELEKKLEQAIEDRKKAEAAIAEELLKQKIAGKHKEEEFAVSLQTYNLQHRQVYSTVQNLSLGNVLLVVYG